MLGIALFSPLSDPVSYHRAVHGSLRDDMVRLLGRLKNALCKVKTRCYRLRRAAMSQKGLADSNHLTPVFTAAGMKSRKPGMNKTILVVDYEQKSLDEIREVFK